MKRRILMIITSMIFVASLCSCNSDKGKNGKESSNKDDTISTVNTIKADASYGDDMVTVCEMDQQTGKNAIKFYDPKTGNIVYACGKANCKHSLQDDNTSCNAVYDDTISYPFLYKDNLYYIKGNEKCELFKSNADGTDKKKILELGFTPDQNEIIFYNGKIYVTSFESISGEEDENGQYMQESGESELYEIDINTGKQKQLTKFGKKADIQRIAMIKYKEKIYLGMQFQNKNIYQSEFKTFDNYIKWLGTEKNSYKEGIEKFDKHSDYYCIDLKKNSVDKMEYNYNMTYEGMQDIKGYYDFRMIYIDDTQFIYSTNYGDKYSLCRYNLKDATTEELDNAYRMTYVCHNRKLYLEKTQYDKTKQLGMDDSEDTSIPPEYKCYDIEKNKWEKINLGKNLAGYILMLEAANDNYLYGYLSSFGEGGDTSEQINSVGVGQFSQAITAVEKTEE
ncbi:hypothetical protein [Eubacterium sp.]